MRFEKTSTSMIVPFNKMTQKHDIMSYKIKLYTFKPFCMLYVYLGVK